MTSKITLSTPIELPNGSKIKNRLMKSAMSENLGDKKHNPPKGLATLYRTWAQGGIGLQVTGNVMVDRTALGEPKNVVLDMDSDLCLFEDWAKAGKENNTHIWMQLNHPGKQIPNFICKEPVAPSAIPLGAGIGAAFNTPRALEEAEILDLVQKFAQSADLAKQSGFTGVQIHCAHGYLISQFLSPRHNKRKDKWGGSPENRIRFLVEVYRAIRKAVGKKFPVGIKLNSADFMKSGFTFEDCAKVAEKMQKEGVNLIEISGGTYESPSMTGYMVRSSTKKREAYFLEYAETLVKKLDIPVAVTGGFRSGTAMENALQSGATSMIGLARPMAVEPDLPNKLLADKAYASSLKRPTTGVAMVDKFSMLDITWYEFQLARLAKGESPDLNQGAWGPVLKTFFSMGAQAFKKRRA
jgi:2,4-dienoyl-CoA reductase-like NADH-dependent reductase (Old Yellow Enzyme family)